jgi:hypothetical protein
MLSAVFAMAMATAAYAVVPAQNKDAHQAAAWDLECSIVNNNTPNKDDYKVNIHLSFNNTGRLNEKDISIIYTDHTGSKRDTLEYLGGVRFKGNLHTNEIVWTGTEQVPGNVVSVGRLSGQLSNEGIITYSQFMTGNVKKSWEIKSVCHFLEAR